MPNQSNCENQLCIVYDIIRTIEEKSADSDYIYRGERELHKEHPYCGKVSSNLWREYGIEEGNFDIEAVQAEMLRGAKKHIGQLQKDLRVDSAASLNMVRKDADETIDFEILTEIQHYGGKTNLIDFTTDYFIALFFACDGSVDEKGRIILQKTDEIRDMINHPQDPRHRVIAQKSVFVRPPKGFIEPREGDIVIIPAHLKQPLLAHLQKYHNISPETVYNDLHGFIRNQDVHGDAYTYFYRGFACRNRGDQATVYDEAQNEYEKSIEHYTKAIELKANLPEAYMNRGNVYRDIYEYPYAIEDYNAAIQIRPDFADAYNNRGIVYYKKGEYDRAIEDYNITISLDSHHASAYNNRGTAYKDKGEIDSAIGDYNTAIQIRQDFAEAYNNRGTAHKDKGEIDRAIGDYDTAIQINPKYAEAYNNRGTAHKDKGEVDRAIGNYDVAIKLNPNLFQPYYNRGVAYSVTGELEKAITDYNKVIKLNPKYAEAYSHRGTAFRDKGEVEKAIADYSQAIVLKPKVAESYYTRGEAWLRIRKWEEAQRDLTAAILQGMDIAEVFHNIHDSIAAFEEETGVKLPEDIVNLLTPRQKPLEIDKETRVALAMKYYENEELSGGLAARLAGVSREEFMYLMGDYGLSPFGTAEDLQMELKNARKTSHQ